MHGLKNEPSVKGKVGEITCLGICHPTEDPAKVETAIRSVLGPGAKFDVSSAESHFGLPMKLITGRTEGDAPFRYILSRMSVEDRHEFMQQLDQRLDDSNRLHVRFDKQSAFAGTPILYSSADPSSRKQRDSIDIEISLITYPGKRETAIEFIGTFMDEKQDRQG